MSEIAIRAENLSKLYQLGPSQGSHFRYKSLRDSLADGLSAPIRRLRRKSDASDPDPVSNTIWALKDVSFEVKQGEVVGVIGRNGAGKSTLLKILSRITEPTEGMAQIHGRIGSLLEVGTGFHPELTGRENVYLNGAILGMRRAEIERQFDEIVAFAEIERFLDTPVKHYSSGMYVRLAFAVAAHLEPEILLVDEVLAVGDAQFQKKCLGKMGDVAKEGRTILFVSHNMGAIVALCGRAILVDGGCIVDDGISQPVVDQYLQIVSSVAQAPLGERIDRRGNQALKFVRFDAMNSEGHVTSTVCSGDDLFLAFKYQAARGMPLKNVHVAIGVHGKLDENLFHLSTSVSQADFEEIPPEGVIVCHIPCLPLQPGRYAFNLFCMVAGEISDWVQNAGVVEVDAGDFFGTGRLPPPEQGVFIVKHSWDVVPGGC